MKISKESIAQARRLLRLCLTEQGLLDEAAVQRVSTRIMEEKPRHYLATLTAFTNLVRLQVKKHTAIITSATELLESEKQDIIQRLAARYEGLSFEWHIDPQLLAGFVIQIGDERIDASVQSRIQRLAKIS